MQVGRSKASPPRRRRRRGRPGGHLGVRRTTTSESECVNTARDESRGGYTDSHLLTFSPSHPLATTFFDHYNLSQLTHIFASIFSWKLRWRRDPSSLAAQAGATEASLGPSLPIVYLKFFQLDNWSPSMLLFYAGNNWVVWKLARAMTFPTRLHTEPASGILGVESIWISSLTRSRRVCWAGLLPHTAVYIVQTLDA